MIVVTGASGFIGNAILDELARLRQVAVAISRQPPPASSPHQFRTADLSHDSSEMRKILNDCAATTLFHLALPPRPSFQSNEQEANSLTSAIDSTLIEACVGSQTLRKVILISSSAVYGSLMAGEKAFSEDRVPAPTSSYGRAKWAQELRWTAAALPAPVVVARIFNLTGPNEPTSLVGGAIAERLLNLPEGGQLALQSSESTRDFVDVRDAAKAILTLSEVSLAPSAALNICSGTGTTVSAFARMIIGVSGKRVSLVPDENGAASRSIGRVGSLGEKLGWRPRFSLLDSIRALWESRVNS